MDDYHARRLQSWESLFQHFRDGQYAEVSTDILEYLGSDLSRFCSDTFLFNWGMLALKVAEVQALTKLADAHTKMAESLEAAGLVDDVMSAVIEIKQSIMNAADSVETNATMMRRDRI